MGSLPAFSPPTFHPPTHTTQHPPQQHPSPPFPTTPPTPPPQRRPRPPPAPPFPGQGPALPLAELAPLAKRMGYDGLELACGGDHFDVQAALADAQYVKDKRALLERHGLQCLAIGNHLVGQALSDLINQRHRAILPPRIWGDGEPEGVRQRAAR